MLWNNGSGVYSSTFCFVESKLGPTKKVISKDRC